MTLNVVEFARALIRSPSVTPADAGAMDLLQHALESLGFACRRMRFGQIENLYARRGGSEPNLCFAGHTDVVPVGDEAAWTSGPFEAALRDGLLIGRGAVDMKGAIAAFVCAAARANPKGSLSLLITGDEEGDAVDGTAKLVHALREDGERIDHCVLGEPTSARLLGDQIKVGRRGSLNATITVHGKQGHVAYPAQTANPIGPLVRLLARLQEHVLDVGYPRFPPSNLEVTSIDVGNPATNVIPATARAAFNIRFNDRWTGASLDAWLQDRMARHGGRWRLDVAVSGESFLTPPGAVAALIAQAVEAATGRQPSFSTTGGTSDARFIQNVCPVAEFGLVGTTMHKVDEAVDLADLEALTEIYRMVLDRYFGNA